MFRIETVSDRQVRVVTRDVPILDNIIVVGFYDPGRYRPMDTTRPEVVRKSVNCGVNVLKYTL